MDMATSGSIIEHLLFGIVDVDADLDSDEREHSQSKGAMIFS
jgi:hypothetical protein